MSDDFPFVEVKQRAPGLTLAELVEAIQDALDNLRTESSFENDYVIGYNIPQSVVEASPEKPWNLSPPDVSAMKKKILRTPGCEPLISAFNLNQGVTPGGGCLDVFLLTSSQGLEPDAVAPAAEAEDITKWRLDPPEKFLLYPYRDDGEAMNLGNLDLNLTRHEARKEIESLIARGKIKHPIVAKYLVKHYSRLASREAEKKSWSDYGKHWYEYHRPRNLQLMKSFPKILTRRMSRDIEFSLDELGAVPTDSCIALTTKDDSPWLQSFKGVGLSEYDALLFGLALLNSSITKFLIKSSADAWQGEFYQIREDTLGELPLKLATKGTLRGFRMVLRIAKEVLRGQKEPVEIERPILALYGLTDDQDFITAHTRSD